MKSSNGVNTDRKDHVSSQVSSAVVRITDFDWAFLVVISGIL